MWAATSRGVAVARVDGGIYSCRIRTTPPGTVAAGTSWTTPPTRTTATTATTGTNGCGDHPIQAFPARTPDRPDTHAPASCASVDPGSGHGSPIEFEAAGSFAGRDPAGQVDPASGEFVFGMTVALGGYLTARRSP